MVVVNIKDEIEVLPKRIDAVATTVKDEIEDDMSESESESEFESESQSESEDDKSESEDESASESESEDDLFESEYESESADENDESDSLSGESLAATARELDINPEEYPRETLVAVARGRGSIIPEQYPYLLPGSKPVPPGWIVAHKGYRAIPGDWTTLPPTTGRGARAADVAVPRYVVPVPNVDDVPRAPAPKSIPPGWKSLPPGWKVLPLGWGMAYREFEVAPPTWRLIPIEYRVGPPPRAPHYNFITLFHTREMAKAHVMMVPFPMQGHVIPLLELAKSLAKHGTKITFVNTEIIHERIFNIDRHKREALLEDGVRLVSVSDGLESNERYIPGKLMEAVYNVIPQKIKELIREIDDTSKEDRITCIIYDQSIGSIQKVAGAMGIRSAAFLPAAAASLVLGFNIPKLIEDGIIDGEGAPLSNKPVQFSPTMPIMSPSDFVWHRIKIPTVQKLIFNIMIQNNIATSSVDRLICNSIHDLEPGAFATSPHIIPIGPLLENSSSSQGHFRQNDSNNCLEWLDLHPTRSVIYVAFGSLAMFNKAQFQELAVGLEITEMPFLWVVRPDNRNFPEGFSKRVLSRGKIVEWAPQQKILSHPSIACFVSHCGWNSTVESVSNGVPILCWPYFADQFINQSYICDIWKIGLKFENDDVTSGEIKDKIRRLIEDCAFKETALCLKEKIETSAREGGNSYNNLKNFITWIKN